MDHFYRAVTFAVRDNSTDTFAIFTEVDHKLLIRQLLNSHPSKHAAFLKIYENTNKVIMYAISKFTCIYRGVGKGTGGICPLRSCHAKKILSEQYGICDIQ